MELPTIPEQLVEADRLCTEARRLVGELRDLAANARKRWLAIKLYNETRWGLADGILPRHAKLRRSRRRS